MNLPVAACTLNFVKAKLELEKIEKSEIPEILLDEGEPVKKCSLGLCRAGAGGSGSKKMSAAIIV